MQFPSYDCTLRVYDSSSLGCKNRSPVFPVAASALRLTDHFSHRLGITF